MKRHAGSSIVHKINHYHTIELTRFKLCYKFGTNNFSGKHSTPSYNSRWKIDATLRLTIYPYINSIACFEFISWKRPVKLRVDRRSTKIIYLPFTKDHLNAPFESRVVNSSQGQPSPPSLNKQCYLPLLINL